MELNLRASQRSGSVCNPDIKDSYSCCATASFKGSTEQLLGLSRISEVPKIRSISCVCNWMTKMLFLITSTALFCASVSE